MVIARRRPTHPDKVRRSLASRFLGECYFESHTNPHDPRNGGRFLRDNGANVYPLGRRAAERKSVVSGDIETRWRHYRLAESGALPNG